MKKILALLISFLVVSSIAQAANSGLTNVTGITATSGGSGGTPGGSSGDLQYNNNGALGGITPGTGVSPALGVNVGSAGAFVVNGGALGTPSSGNGSNLTSLNASQISSGTLDASRGGLGAASPTAHRLIVGNGSSAVQQPDPGSSGQVLMSNGSSADPSFQSRSQPIPFTIDGGGSTITTGSKGFYNIGGARTITGWQLVCDASGSIVVDVKYSTYASFPTTASIAGSEKPTLSSAQKNQDLSLSTWTTAVADQGVLELNVDSATTVTRCNGTIFTTTP